MMCIDFRKAFDSIERDFIFYALRKLKFGVMFQKWISVILSNSNNCMINNGHISDPFKVDYGVRQGCLIASSIFVLAIELLACKIRQTNQIHGIALPFDVYDRNEIRISTFADDTTILVKLPIVSRMSYQCLMNLLNYLVLPLIRIRSLKNNDYCVGDINWKLAPNNTIKMLGVTFSPNILIDNIECNWISKMNKIEGTIRVWKMRGLSMIGNGIET